MSFPMYRQFIHPGSGEKRLPHANPPPTTMPTRPVLTGPHIMPDNTVPRFMAGPAPAPMLVLPPTGILPAQQAPHGILTFQNPSLASDNTSQGQRGKGNMIGSGQVSSLPLDAQNYMNPAGSAYPGVNFGMPPPNIAGVPVSATGSFPPAPVPHPQQQQPMQQPAARHMMPSAWGQPIIDLSDHEVDPEQPVADPQRTILDFFNSDLNLEISKNGYEAKNFFDPPGFAFCWAGARATYGVCTGKVFYEVRIVEKLKVDFGDEHEESNPHLLRIGWSMNHTSLQLGEELDSWGYGGTGRFSTNNTFALYGEPYGLGDVVSALLDLESKPPTISFARNGQWLGIASPLYGYNVGCPEKALYPHILSKNCRFEVNFGQNAPWCPLLPHGCTFIDYLPIHSRVRGSLPLRRKAECEMIMIVGLPGSGKTTWGMKMSQEHPEKHYNIIGTDTLIDKMKVMGLSRKNNYHGRWDVLIKMATNCLNKLFILASRRHRNYILDQTNVYASARKRKMKYFVGFKRICAVLQPHDDELKRREWKRTFEDGKVVPEEAVLEMKCNYSLPDIKDEYVDELIWIEMDKQDAHDIVRQYGEEGRTKLQSRKRLAGADNDSSSDTSHKQRKIWDNQVQGSSDLEFKPLTPSTTSSSAPPPPPPDFFNSEQQSQGFDNMGNFKQELLGFQQFPPLSSQPQNAAIFHQQQPFQSFPPPTIPVRPLNSVPPQTQQTFLPQPPMNQEGLCDSWEGRPRIPNSQGLLQTPSGPTNPTNPFSIPDVSQPPPPLMSLQADFHQPPPSFQPHLPKPGQPLSEQQPHWPPQQQQQKLASEPPNFSYSGDVDIRADNQHNFPRDMERGPPTGRFNHQAVLPLMDIPSHHENEPRDGRNSRDREYGRDNNFDERRDDDWGRGRDSRREPEGHQGRERGRDYDRNRDDDRWGRKDRPSRRTPERNSSNSNRGHSRGDDRRNSREGSRDNRKWNDDRDQRNRSRERVSFQDRSHRSRWEGGDDRPYLGQNRPQQSKSLLGDSPQPLVSPEMIETWKDGNGANFNEIPPQEHNLQVIQQQRPPPHNTRFAGPRPNQPPPPLRGPRPMPPRVPPPSMGPRGPPPQWPQQN